MNTRSLVSCSDDLRAEGEAGVRRPRGGGIRAANERSLGISCCFPRRWDAHYAWPFGCMPDSLLASALAECLYSLFFLLSAGELVVRSGFGASECRK